jgi:hypothetical protein
MTTEYNQPTTDCKQNGSTQLSSAEVQAMLVSPHFKHIDRDAVIRAGAKILRTTEKSVEGWRQLSGSDSQNVFVCLLTHLNEWADGLELSRTPHGGFMQMRNVRLLELASGKCDRGGRKTDEHGTELPCLEDFDLSICCAMLRGPQDRMWSFFRICHVDEVPRRDGKKLPYKPPVTTKAKAPLAAIPMQPAPEQPLREAQQSSMFDTGSFLSYETGGRR